MIEEDYAEHKHTAHHGESTRVVWVRRRDKPLVLCVQEGTHRNLEYGNYKSSDYNFTHSKIQQQVFRGLNSL